MLASRSCTSMCPGANFWTTKAPWMPNVRQFQQQRNVNPSNKSKNTQARTPQATGASAVIRLPDCHRRNRQTCGSCTQSVANSLRALRESWPMPERHCSNPQLCPLLRKSRQSARRVMFSSQLCLSRHAKIPRRYGPNPHVNFSTSRRYFATQQAKQP